MKLNATRDVSTAHPSDWCESVHRIEIREWECRDYPLPTAAIQDLARFPSKVLNLQVLPTGAARLTAGSYVGRLRLGSVDVVLHPKRPVPSLLLLLKEVYELATLVPELTGFHATTEIVDLLVQVFLRQVDELVRKGLNRMYVTREEDLVPVRGRIDIRRTFDLHMRARARVSCSFEDYTFDGIENRALLAALLAIAANGALRQERRRVAHALTSDFSGVSVVPMTGREVAAIKCDRLLAHYEPVLRLAEMILASMGLANDFGGIGSNGFLLDMNRLFEEFIDRRLCRLLVPDGFAVMAQQTYPFDEQQQAMIKPDLVIRAPRGRRLVADTKYKDKRDAVPADLYQMLTYCRVLHLKHGVLITLGDRAIRQYKVQDGETIIEVVPIHLDGSIGDIQASVEALARFIRDRLQALPYV